MFGGSDGKQDGNELFIYDTETMQWSMPSLEGKAPIARVGHTGSAVGSTKVYYFGGYGYHNDFYYFYLLLLLLSLYL